MTYKNCKILIETADKKRTKNKVFIRDMTVKLDIFLLANRITDLEYRELNSMLVADTK